MKVYFHPHFYDDYTSDPAAATGRMEAIVEAITPFAEILPCMPASEDDLLTANMSIILLSVVGDAGSAPHFLIIRWRNLGAT